MPRYPIERWKETLYMSEMEVGSNQRWSAPSTMTSWHHFHLTVTQNFQNLTQLQLCSNSVRVHSYAYVPHSKGLKHFIYVHYGCGKLQWSTGSTITSWHHFHPTVTKNCQNLTQLRQCNSVRVHSYAYVPHWKVKRHFIYVHFGCGNQSKVAYRLNHDIMASSPLDRHPELLKTITQGSAV